MVDLHKKIRHLQSLENFLHDSKYLRVGDHRIVFSSNVEVALVELSVSAFGDGWLVSTVDLADVESFDFLDVGVVSHEASERNSQIVSEGAFFSSLVFQVVDQL